MKCIFTMLLLKRAFMWLLLNYREIHIRDAILLLLWYKILAIPPNFSVSDEPKWNKIQLDLRWIKPFRMSGKASYPSILENDQVGRPSQIYFLFLNNFKNLNLKINLNVNQMRSFYISKCSIQQKYWYKYSNMKQ